ncbi:MAG: DUF4177 domain-containing protein [Lachnospiraceae bacterium]|nr:DUF4177 domain-containing protein [Lachnospiraceae bacterium]
MAKTCVACGKNIGLMTVRIPLIDNEEVFICADCFSKMPPVLNDIYQQQVSFYKSELIEVKESVIQKLNLKGFNTDTRNIVAKFFDNKIAKAKNKVDDDNAIVQKICPICKKRVTYECTSCTTCGYVFSEEIVINLKEIAEMYNNRIEQYRKNPFYEYDYIVIQNNSDGSTNKEKIEQIIQKHALQGWRLVTMYSNEIGKNALAVSGIGANSTMCEDILLFERCIKAEQL